MIQREYLERLERDFAAQIREHENNAAASRGALQVIQHLIEKYEEGAAAVSAAPPSSEVENLVKESDNGRA